MLGTEWVVSLIQQHGPASVFVAVLAEEIIIPIPSALVVMTAAFLLIPASATFGEASVLIITNIVIPGMFATAIGSLFIYFIAHYGGDALIRRYPSFFETSVAEVEKMGDRLEKGNKVWVTLAILRAIPVIPTSIVSLASGLLHLEWKKFFIATLIGAMPRLFILGFMGWQVGASYTKAAETFGAAEAAVIVLSVAIILFLFVRWKKGKAAATPRPR